MPQAMHAKTSKAPRMTRSKAPVERCVGLLDLWTMTTVLEWVVVPGAPVVGEVAVDGTAGVVVGVGVVPIVEVELGATVPGWAPFAGVVLTGAVAAGTVDTGAVVAGAGVVEPVVVCTRADAGIEMPKARSVVIVVLVAEAGAALTSRLSIAPKQRARARTLSKSRARTWDRP
jgi:hypothetical protein